MKLSGVNTKNKVLIAEEKILSRNIYPISTNSPPPTPYNYPKFLKG